MSTSPSERNAIPVELIGEFVTVAYCGPPPEETTLDRYREIAEAGIDILVPGNGAFDGPTNLRAMDLAEQVGIRILPWDMRIASFALSLDYDIDATAIDALVADYGGHPAFAGYVVRDEPNADMFERLDAICRLFRERDPNHEPLINLYPGYGSPAQLGFEDFRGYVRGFIQAVRPAILSYDHYPLREDRTSDSDWYGDLAIIRQESRRAGIPFWIFIQAEGIRGYLRVPNREEALWQTNTALAYGARGIAWFCYWTPPANQKMPAVEGAPPPLVEQHYNAMIGLDGKRTPVYDAVREANLFARKAGRALIGWDNTRVTHYPGKPSPDDTGSTVIVQEGSKLVVGTFSQGDARRAVLANDSYENACRFTLRGMGNTSPVQAVVAALDAEPATGSPAEWACALAPGGCIVVDLAKP